MVTISDFPVNLTYKVIKVYNCFSFEIYNIFTSFYQTLLNGVAAHIIVVWQTIVVASIIFLYLLQFCKCFYFFLLFISATQLDLSKELFSYVQTFYL